MGSGILSPWYVIVYDVRAASLLYNRNLLEEFDQGQVIKRRLRHLLEPKAVLFYRFFPRQFEYTTLAHVTASRLLFMDCRMHGSRIILSSM